MIGESPTRPAIFQERPLVVVTPDISPLLFSARQLMVPVGGFSATCMAHSIHSGLALGKRRSSSDFFLAFSSGAERPGPQLLWPFGSRSDSLQTSQARRAFSVRR